MRFLQILYTVLMLLLLISCRPASKVSTNNISYLYQVQEDELRPELLVHNFTVDSSRLYIRLYPQQLLFEGDSERRLAHVIVNTKLYQSYETAHVIDTVSRQFYLRQEQNNFPVITTIDFKLPGDGDHLLEVKITDAKRKNNVTLYKNVNSSALQNRQTFLLYINNDSIPAFRNYAQEDDVLTLKHRNNFLQYMTVRYYNRSFPVAAPPFSVDNLKPFNYAADSIFKMSIDTSFRLPGIGFYHFQSDTTIKAGYTIFRYHEDFPKLTTAERLLEPLRYFTTRREFDELMRTSNAKDELDKFWLRTGGNQERARYLISKFYSRVQEANNLFSSYTEGWKTDRGMIYIVYGIPNIVYRDSHNEYWIYGEMGNLLSTNFTFSRVINPFTDNDYSLNRSPTYENYWYTAVDTWRQGRVFNDR